MKNSSSTHKRYIVIAVGLSFLLLFMMATFMSQAIAANGLEANLESSAKTVDLTEAEPGETVQYSILISNTGSTSITNVLMMDTLPTEVMYQADSLTITAGSSYTNAAYGQSNGVITWTGTLSVQGYVSLGFEATLTGTLLPGVEVVNTAVITGTGSWLTRTATITVVEPTMPQLFMPIILTPPPIPDLELSRVNIFNDWTASWTNFGDGVSYELQEAKSQAFNAPQTVAIQSEDSYTFDHAVSPDNIYCYRVRAIKGFNASDWSNIECVIGGYFDEFSDTSTNWAIRRQDTDDVDNKSYYQEKRGEHFFVLEIDGRWDYGIASPLNKAPEPPYAIEGRVKLNEPDNLNAYGFIFGANWDGTSQCPVADYSTCFTQYYRLILLYYGNTHHLRLQLKRIDRHEGGNAGRGESIIHFKDVYVDSPATDFKIWRIEVHEDGTIAIYVNGHKVAGTNDTAFIHNPYFGIFAATDEYLGAEPWFDWYKVRSLFEEE